MPDTDKEDNLSEFFHLRNTLYLTAILSMHFSKANKLTMRTTKIVNLYLKLAHKICSVLASVDTTLHILNLSAAMDVQCKLSISPINHSN